MRRIESRVKEGASFMDQLLPDGWEDRIRARDLNIAFDTTCVLGQCFRSYDRITKLLEISPAEARALGFFEFEGPNRGRRYRRLTRAWAREVRDRLNSRVLVPAI